MEPTTTYWLTRFVFQRGLGFIYLAAFLVALNQFRPLLGERGILPVPNFLKQIRFWDAPSLFQAHYSDRFFLAIAVIGVLLAAAAMIGLSERGPLWVSILTWALLWILYLSIVNVGQTFYSFGWETLLLEIGFLSIFLGNSKMAPPLLIIYLLRWVLFRLEFGAGLIKIRGDDCWRDLTCLNYHHETQPMPNPLSWFFHHLPKSFHKVEVLGNHFAQLIVPWGIFFPQPIAFGAGALIITTQLWLIISGNFSFLNFLAILLALTTLPDSVLQHIIPIKIPEVAPLSIGHEAFLWMVTAVILILSVNPVRNLLSRRQLMNASFEPLHLVNTYGAFGSVTKKRIEVVVEGTDEAVLLPNTRWREYEFKGKPGGIMRRPPQVAPYHYRLDWQMWFLPFAPVKNHPWFLLFARKLLQGDKGVVRLLRENPFPDLPPRFIRARAYEYRFTTPKERRETKAWWHRELVGEYLPPLSLEKFVERP